jgi:hypothetical protein
MKNAFETGIESKAIVAIRLCELYRLTGIVPIDGVC